MSDPYLLFQIAKHSYKLHTKLLQASKTYLNYYLRYKQNIDDHFQQVITRYDRIEYKIEGKLHRIDDLPAIIYNDGTRKWYKYGRCHRDNDLPAIIYSYGTRRWYKYGEYHREKDLPAVICNDGPYEWCMHGHVNRDNGLPCIIYNDGARLMFDGRRYFLVDGNAIHSCL